MIDKLWTVAIISFGLYWINPFITVFACQLINVVDWFIFHDDVKRCIREIGIAKIDL